MLVVLVEYRLAKKRSKKRILKQHNNYRMWIVRSSILGKIKKRNVMKERFWKIKDAVMVQLIRDSTASTTKINFSQINFLNFL